MTTSTGAASAANDTCLDPPVKEVWARARESLARRLSHPTYQAWILPSRLLSIEATEATIAVANDVARNILTRSHLQDISQAISQVLGREISTKIVIEAMEPDQESYTPSIASISVVQEPGSQTQVRQRKATEPAQAAVPHNTIQPRHRFANFIVGSSNRLCHSACIAVAERPGQSYNPLFIYGGVGLGKTHLLHAIGNEALELDPARVVRYMTCEKFTNELINSIRDQSMAEFRRRYRQVDILLMDDIQFIENKESTQEEFFHTFNALRDSGKQIVLTSDRPPKALSHLTERLRSRFEWGLIADIQPPDYETRLAILSTKAETDGLTVKDEILEHIAATFTSNIRELEGALLRAHAYSKLTGNETTLASLKDILEPGGRRQKTVLTMESIIEAVCGYYQIEPMEIKSTKRTQDIVVPRQIAMYLARDLLDLSFPRIGQYFKIAHPTVMSGRTKIAKAIQDSPDVGAAVRQIKQKLGC